MSSIKDSAQLGKLVAHHHGWAAAKTFKTYALNETDQAALSRAARDLLKVFPQVPRAGALMSAALAVTLERQIAAPIHLVAGTLSLEGAPVIGDGGSFDGAEVFAGPQFDWDGHVWLMMGPQVVDIGLFRLAYSGEGPARLAKHVDLVFGPGKALYVDHWSRTRKQGLRYEPHYVLSSEEVTRLMGHAFRAIQAARGGPSHQE
ncbi:hypothetical protein HT136_10750 [Novosphingobium profundi]|uniref:hypothetical protein n=1 Tax=Novosphingobium profundi TaxID=1774954 RepID=UPI001BD94850|nr:hypothetical protein [Novosphingobium profundi]MBT0668844.1 hypothetical protein [Novosphingobium profundi]